jgi:hypothetical protein
MLQEILLGNSLKPSRENSHVAGKLAIDAYFASAEFEYV